jgi:mono/diheme cytochrome c family protein
MLSLLLLACALFPEPPPPSDPAPVPVVLSPAARAGRIAFRAECQACHGFGAAGDGPAADALDPTPADLRGRLHDTTEIVRRVRQGSEGSAMQPWRDRLEGEEIEQIAAWLAGLSAPEPEGS